MSIRKTFRWLPRPVFSMARSGYHGLINAKWAIVRIGERTRASWPDTCWQLAGRFRKHVTINTSHGRMTFGTGDQVIGKALYFTGAFDRDKAETAFALLQRENCLMPSRTYLIDVGANIGTVCIDLVRQNRFTRAIALEPDPQNFAFLRRNIRQNRLAEQITPLAIGLSSEPATVTFEKSNDNYGDHRVRLKSPDSDVAVNAFAEEKRQTTTIEVKRLDDVLASLHIAYEEIGLLWIDVQGHEWHVLRGAQGLLQAGVPVLMEFWPYALGRAGVTPDNFNTLVTEHFTHFINLDEDDQMKHEISEVGCLFKKYSGKTQTDLLLLRT